jgi:hypothetical protein
MLVRLRNRGEQEIFARLRVPWVARGRSCIDLRLSSVADIDNATTALALLNLRRYGAQNADPLFAVYERELGQKDVFKDAREVRTDGFADCEDLASAWLAQQWVLGFEARSAATVYPEPHARCRVGSILFDPSFLWTGDLL